MGQGHSWQVFLFYPFVVILGLMVLLWEMEENNTLFLIGSGMVAADGLMSRYS